MSHACRDVTEQIHIAHAVFYLCVSSLHADVDLTGMQGGGRGEESYGHAGSISVVTIDRMSAFGSS